MACSRHALEPSSVEVVAGICAATATTKNFKFQAFSRRKMEFFMETDVAAKDMVSDFWRLVKPGIIYPVRSAA